MREATYPYLCLIVFAVLLLCTRGGELLLALVFLFIRLPRKKFP